jgi:hypothetical protein
MIIRYNFSSVPVPIHVDETEEISNLTPDLVEPSMGLVVGSDQVPVCTVAERSVG